jgi:hypothetical protein
MPCIYKVRSMSALPPKADIAQHGGNVRFGPAADINPQIDWLNRVRHRGLEIQSGVSIRGVGKKMRETTRRK